MFFPLCFKTLSNSGLFFHCSNSNLGAFSFIDDGYLRGFFNPQLRGAFHIDRIYENARANGIEYEYHLQKPNWHKKNLKLKKILNKLGVDKTKEGEF